MSRPGFSSLLKGFSMSGFEIVDIGHGFVDVTKNGKFIAQFVDGLFSLRPAREIAQEWIDSQNLSSSVLQAVLIEVYSDMLRIHDNGEIVDLNAVTYEACRLADLDYTFLESIQEHVQETYGNECEALNQEIECLYGDHN